MVKYVVPSFQRPVIFRDQTYSFLKKHNISDNDIHLFLRSDDPYLNDYMDRATGINFHITDVRGVGRTHNFITETFDEGEYIVEIDDDLKELVDNERKPIKDFKSVVESMLSRMVDEEISYGGTYQVANTKFMSDNPQYTTDLRYLLGCVRFRRIRKDIVLETNYSEDFENCILHFLRDGKILKNNWICPITKNYQDGGCKNDGRDNETEKSDKVFIATKYPKYSRIFQRKNGVWDLRVRKYKV